VTLFDSIGTQWRASMAGFTGLDYNILYHKLDRMRLSDSDYDDIEEAVRILEDEALATMFAMRKAR